MANARVIGLRPLRHRQTAPALGIFLHTNSFNALRAVAPSKFERWHIKREIRENQKPMPNAEVFERHNSFVIGTTKIPITNWFEYQIQQFAFVFFSSLISYLYFMFIFYCIGRIEIEWRRERSSKWRRGISFRIVCLARHNGWRWGNDEKRIAVQWMICLELIWIYPHP